MIWDVALAKLLRHRESRFQLDLRFASAARRIVLFGPSGAGKSLAMRLIAGIGRPDAGHVRIDGRTLYDSARGTDCPPQRRQLAFVFQDYALFPHLTVRQNIAFARRSGWLNPRRDVADSAADRWIEAFHLAPVQSLYPHQLSGGQRQRTALARALVNEPAALLLDEPFAALDQRLRTALRDELRELQAGLQLPMLLITHDDDDVAAFAEDVVQIEAGRVVSAAPPVPGALPAATEATA